jgi:4-amino-4-deoxy-L-arabinose transferase-like glycosyltransferase
MDKTIKLITKIGVVALVVVAIIFTVWMKLDISLTVAYITLGIAVFVALIFPLVRIIVNPKQLIKVLLGAVAIGAVVLISRLIASNDFTAQQLEKLHVTESTSVWVGAMLNLTFIVGIVAILAAIFLAVKGSISK